MSIKEEIREHIQAIESIANSEGFDHAWTEAISQIQTAVELRGHSLSEMISNLNHTTARCLR